MGFKIKKIKEKKISENNNLDFKKNIPYIFGVLSVIVIFFIGFFTVKSIGNFNFNFNFNFSVSNLIPNIGVFNSEKEIKDIKILLVGRGGGTHDGANLTDSIILMSLNLDKNVITMLSIPRDFYVKYTDKRYGKINGIYSYYLGVEGNNQEKAMDHLKNKIAQITGMQIDYYVNIDFSGFKKIVDMLGGVEVEVPETLVDNLYPNEENGTYTTFILKKGTWTLDGETALKYSRSRHSTSDFDRSMRQQKILSAIKEKLIMEGYFKSPSKIKEMYNALTPYFTTDIGLGAMLKLVKNIGNFSKGNKIISLNLNNSCFYGVSTCSVGGILYSPPLEEFGASVVVPRGANFYNLEIYSEIQRFSTIVFNYPEIFTDKLEVNIFNSLNIPNQALNLASDLQQYGFNVPEKDSIGNTSGVIYDNTTIYYNKSIEGNKTLDAMKLFIKGKYVPINENQFSKNQNTKIEIVIGKDFKEVSDFDGKKLLNN